MQKEELIKRMRLFVTLTTLAFVLLVVILLVQFGFIAHYHSEMKHLQDRNAQLQKEIDGVEREDDYTNGEYPQDKDPKTNKITSTAIIKTIFEN